MEKTLKQQIVTAAEAVKRKIRKMRDIESGNRNVLESVFKPITNPLNQIVDTNKHIYYDGTRNGVKPEIKDEFHFPFSTRLDDTNEEVTEALDNTEESDCNFNSSKEHDMSNESFETIRSNSNSPSQKGSSPVISMMIPFGLREENGRLKMGSANANVSKTDITVAERKYESTPGLLDLLYNKEPNMKLITEDDKRNYKLMLLDTNAHRRNFDPKKPIKSNKGRKYLDIIKPLFQLPDTESNFAQGTGLPLVKRLKKDIDYIYWDDPNELVERLKLLIASKNAGNTGLDNEIITIVEELRESGILN